MFCVLGSTDSVKQASWRFHSTVGNFAAVPNAAGEVASDLAQHAKQDVQEGLRTIEEGLEDVPSSNAHHPILGMRSPLHRLTSQGTASGPGIYTQYHRANLDCCILNSLLPAARKLAYSLMEPCIMYELDQLHSQCSSQAAQPVPSHFKSSFLSAICAQGIVCSTITIDTTFVQARVYRQSQ